MAAGSRGYANKRPLRGVPPHDRRARWRLEAAATQTNAPCGACRRTIARPDGGWKPRLRKQTPPAGRAAARSPGQMAAGSRGYANKRPLRGVPPHDRPARWRLEAAATQTNAPCGACRRTIARVLSFGRQDDPPRHTIQQMGEQEYPSPVWPGMKLRGIFCRSVARELVLYDTGRRHTGRQGYGEDQLTSGFRLTAG